MRTFIIIIGFLIIANALYAQDEKKKNSVIIETNLLASTSVSYNRIIPLKEKTSATIGGSYIMGTGFGYGSNWIAGEAGGLFFGPKHFLDTALLLVVGIDDDSSPGIRVAYRLLGEKGFTFRASANFYMNIDPIFVPSIGIGYTF